MTQFNFEGIGTTWQIDIYQNFSLAEEERILSEIKTGEENKNITNVISDNISETAGRKGGGGGRRSGGGGAGRGGGRAGSEQGGGQQQEGVEHVGDSVAAVRKFVAPKASNVIWCSK